MDHLIKPHGGTLVNLLADEERVAQLKAESQGLVSMTLSQRQLPYHYDFEPLRDMSQELRHLFDKLGWRHRKAHKRLRWLHVSGS